MNLLERLQAHARGPVPETLNGLPVLLRFWTEAERAEFDRWRIDTKDETTRLREGYARALILSATDEAGNPCFTLEQLPALLALREPDIHRVGELAWDLNTPTGKNDDTKSGAG